MIPASTRRLLSVLEMTALLAGSLALLWLWAPRLDRSLWSALAYLLTASAVLAYVFWFSPVRLHRDLPAARGLGPRRTYFVRTDNLREALPVYALLAFAGTVLVLGLALWRDPNALALFTGLAFRVKLGFYLFSGLGQQLFFVGFFLPRMREALAPDPGGLSIPPARPRILICLGSALLFALFHFPNPPLMGFVLLFEFALCWVALSWPNLLLAVLCHAWLGTLLHRIALVPMRIGPFYWEPNLYVYRTLFPFLHEWIGNLF
jgi:hypothetical protein